ncbi:hypothetical protein N1028_11855 [Herbiconiux sp. CPCC 203407]|uniref:Uncharacterized protein n=1 Tax=Herbiconiux oxytropis TaxID=2970915 RepID=A0AA41XIL0_9MICO|nr:hypothetical protein [Herbiconiux oxytropis]MCS5723806.1 hypothetical protein [Herbiconiux oxytropis]MCS5726588.1 hypothetical protein [Herbiconiux oxytropis]
MTTPDPRADGLPSSDAKDAPDAPLTRRQLRELRQAEIAAAEAAASQAAGIPAPLTRRQLRERELALRAEEIADLEIAPAGTAPLDPHVDLPLVHLETGQALDVQAPVVAETVATRRDARIAAQSAAPAARRELARPPASGPRSSKRPGTTKSGTTNPGTTKPGATRRARAKAGLSAVAMAFVVGITAVIALPTTVSADPDDANVVNLSLSTAAPATQQLVTAADSSTEFVDRDGYSVSDAGELQAAGYSTAQLLVGRSLAQELVDAMDSGKLIGSVPDHMKEIRWIAQGVTVPDCGVDYRVLEIIAIAVRNFDQVGVSDINRKCTGQIEGAGTSSSHYIDGGGHAVDFYLLDNKSLNGADPGTLKMIQLLDPVMPVGSRVGQAGCRASAGVSVSLTNWTEFDDTCSHMHVDVPVTDAPLLMPSAGE